MFPAEIWEMIAKYAGPVELFALMQTSKQLRAVASPFYAPLLRTLVCSGHLDPSVLDHVITVPSAFRIAHEANQSLFERTCRTAKHYDTYIANIFAICNRV